MKKIFKWVRLLLVTVILSSIILSLTACVFNVLVPENVSIDFTTYRTGFYGDLWPQNILLYKSGPYKIWGRDFYQLGNEKFDFVKGEIGDKTEGTFYCAESQWEQARAYYADNNNFVYYCNIGGNFEGHKVPIPNIDNAKFDALLAFAKKNAYDPFGLNEDVKTRRMPEPDRDVSPELVFYKESKDGYFTSDRGYSFHLIDGKLLLLFYYDEHNGKSELVAVDVPDDLGQYFVELVGQLKT